MTFVKNNCTESLLNQVADMSPGTGLKTEPAFQSLLTKAFAIFLYAISLFTSHGTFGETRMVNLESEMRYYLQNKRARRSQEFVTAHIPILFLSPTPTPEILYQPD